MLGIGWAYVSLTPVMGLLAGAFLGVQSAVVMRAVLKIDAHILKDRWLWAVAVIGFVATLAETGVWIVLIAGGAAYAVTPRPWSWPCQPWPDGRYCDDADA